MFNFSKVSSLALGLALVGGLGLSNLASANTASHTQEKQLFVENGSDHPQQNRVAEGGADRLQELRERVALVAPGDAVRGGVIVADNRAEFGSKYQRY
ncbi:phage infection protein [Pseudomonas sp. 14P_8.1_Bac3]|uniref:phage infection protein n=1 Tax=Pseudomonas sp. 14P_8.1_Bac3 TaxID=2971621 RepID=UPI0021C8FB47|nr:phage infection protein [Pseudomonas sp. 14P_8.1_Bac3]MCU1761630.1 phage infection protein [Pseudomonas sp. 14P_8.1_Bac3]